MIPLEISFKAKVRAAARKREIHADELWRLIAVERLLARISVSEFSERFILKGGMLLMTYLELGRGTQDIDFSLQQVEWQSAEVERVFDAICCCDLEDHFRYDDVAVAPLVHPTMPFPGHRVRLRAQFGKTRYVLTVDMARGDLVDPIRRHLSLSKFSYEPLVGGSVEIQCYPPEFIFAEKLQAITERFDSTSRMKDFYDLRRMSQEQGLLNHQRLQEVIRSVFTYRGTDLIVPLRDSPLLQPLWQRFVAALPLNTRQHIPLKLSAVLSDLNHWFEKHTDLCHVTSAPKA